MRVRIGRRFALTLRFESIEPKLNELAEPPLGADDGELARWSSRPLLDMDIARCGALALHHGGGYSCSGGR